MKITQMEIEKIHASYVAMVEAGIAGKSIQVQLLMASQARAGIAAQAMADAFGGNS
jgi:hypothetical protein